MTKKLKAVYFANVLAVLGLFAIMILSINSCSTMSSSVPKTTNAKIYALDASIKAIGQSTIDLYQSGKINQSQVKYVYEGLSTAATLTDSAQKAYATNATNADLIVEEATTLLSKLQVYLNTSAAGGK